MKRFLLGLIVLMSVCAFCLTGCNNSSIRLITNHFYFPVGESLSTDLADYVRASKTMLSQMTLDVSEVDSACIGSYMATVTYQEEILSFTIEITDLTAPDIQLKADTVYVEAPASIRVEDVVEQVEDLSDFVYGFSDDMTLSDAKKTMLDTLTFNTTGSYNCEILAKDSFGNYSVMPFTVKAVEPGKVPSGSVYIEDYSAYMNQNRSENLADLSSYSSEANYFGVGTAVDEDGRPNLSHYEKNFGDFAVDFIQPDSKYIWLTFNSSSEAGTTETILDTLLEKNVKAVFFITLSYAKNNPKLVQRMIDEGHVLGNYTASCVNVTGLDVNELTNEINSLYNYVHENFGYDMYLFRTPAGNFSEQSLALAEQLGYRTVFWSFNYVDWNQEAQMEPSEALDNALAKAHGGAIYMLSGASSTNQTILPDLIDGLRAKGYEFAYYQQFQ